MGSALALGVEPWDTQLVSECQRMGGSGRFLSRPSLPALDDVDDVTSPALCWPRLSQRSGRVRGHTHPPPGGKILSQPSLENAASYSHDTVTGLSACRCPQMIRQRAPPARWRTRELFLFGDMTCARAFLRSHLQTSLQAAVGLLNQEVTALSCWGLGGVRRRRVPNPLSSPQKQLRIRSYYCVGSWGEVAVTA